MALELRPYQRTAVERLRDGIRFGRRRQVLVAPTGAGKTEIAMEIVRGAQAKGSKVVFIVDRKALIDQTSARFDAAGIDHGVIQAKHARTDPSKPIQIASAQTLARRPIEAIPDLVIVDECHTRHRAVIALIARAREAKVIGLTATPFSSGLMRDFDASVDTVTTDDLLAQGYLAPLRIKACVAPDLRDVKRTSSGEYDAEDAGQRGIVIAGDVVRSWVAETARHFDFAPKTIVFAASVAHGAELCREFGKAGFRFVQLSHEDDDKARRAAIAEFRKPDSSIHGLISCAVLTKGFDVPDTLCGISCRPYRKSFSSHVQELGRVMRVAPGKGYGLWLDHSGNAVAFATDTARLFARGAGSLREAVKLDKQPREPLPAIRSEFFCDGCGFQIARGQTTCSECGFGKPRRGNGPSRNSDIASFDAVGDFQARSGLADLCLGHPGRMWNAALVHCLAHGRRGEDAARKWAFGVWKALYPTGRLSHEAYHLICDQSAVTAAEKDFVSREVRLFFIQRERRAA